MRPAALSMLIPNMKFLMSCLCANKLKEAFFFSCLVDAVKSKSMLFLERKKVKLDFKKKLPTEGKSWFFLVRIKVKVGSIL